MNWPSTVLRVRIVNGGRRRVNLWIPLFLVWLLFLVPVLLLLPLVFLVGLLLSRSGGAGEWRRTKAALNLVLFVLFLPVRVRGLCVDINEPDESVLVKIT